MLARLQGAEGPIAVKPVGQSVVHHLHRGIFQDGLIAPIAPGEAVTPSESIGLLQGAAGDGMGDGPAGIPDGGGHDLGDLAHTEDGPVERFPGHGLKAMMNDE